MPKRHGNLFDAMFSPDALHAAYLAARRRKRKKAAVAAFERNLGANLQRLHDDLHAGRYASQPYMVFEVREPKPRTIYAPHFRDVVVQHAMYAVLYPIFDATFCRESYGCRKGMGTHRASNRAQQFLRQSPEDSFVLQMDIRKFFYRIDRDILRRLWARKIKDVRALALLDMFANYPEPSGIPIGNLISQLAALVYLDPLDQFVKRELKAARYVRYVDDFILFGLSRDEACAAKARIETFLAERLRLELSRWTIQPVRRGVNFVGFRAWRKTRFVRRHSLHTFSRALRRGNVRSLNSIMGNARHSATHAHFCRRIRAERPDLIPILPLYQETP